MTKRPDATSRHRGVTRFSNGGRYQAFVKVNGNRIHLGMWADEDSAAVARDRCVLALGLDLPLNLPRRARKLGPATAEQLRRLARATQKRERSSPYFGVAWDDRRQRWAAVICTGNKRKLQIAQFDHAKDAALAYDRVALEVHGSAALLNFPDRRTTPATLDEVRQWARELLKQRTSSRYRGVQPAATPDLWAARLHHRGRAISVGQWETERAAALAYDRAALTLFGDEATLNFPRRSRALGPASISHLRREARRRFKRQTSSRFRGVHLEQRSKKWVAAIKKHGETRHLGTFEVEEDAAVAYDRAARRLHGKRAVLNFRG